MNLTIPWILAVITALWFGWMARQAERNLVLWVLGGGLFALVTSTIVFGLGHASTIPFSEQERSTLQMKWTIISVVLIAVLGWLLTLGLHRKHLLIWRLIRPGATQTGLTPASAAEAEPKTSPLPKSATETPPASKPVQEQRSEGKNR